MIPNFDTMLGAAPLLQKDLQGIRVTPGNALGPLFACAKNIEIK